VSLYSNPNKPSPSVKNSNKMLTDTLDIISKADKVKLFKPTTSTAMGEKEKSDLELLIEFYTKVCDNADYDAATRIISADCHFYASGSLDPVGFDDFFNYISLFQRRLLFKHSILDSLSQDGKVLIHWRVDGLHHGELLGFKPSGLPVKYTGMSLFNIIDKKIVKAISIFDEKSLIAQLSNSP
jgi:predicted ester cyclase